MFRNKHGGAQKMFVARRSTNLGCMLSGGRLTCKEASVPSLGRRRAGKRRGIPARVKPAGRPGDVPPKLTQQVGTTVVSWLRRKDL